MNIFKFKKYHCDLALKMRKFPKTLRGTQTNKTPTKVIPHLHPKHKASPREHTFQAAELMSSVTDWHNLKLKGCRVHSIANDWHIGNDSNKCFKKVLKVKRYLFQ